MRIPEAGRRRRTRSTAASRRMRWRFTGGHHDARARRSSAFPISRATPATLDLLQSRGIVVFGADLWASDWNR